jgi:hypothetical protein
MIEREQETLRDPAAAAAAAEAAAKAENEKDVNPGVEVEPGTCPIWCGVARWFFLGARGFPQSCSFWWARDVTVTCCHVKVKNTLSAPLPLKRTTPRPPPSLDAFDRRTITSCGHTFCSDCAHEVVGATGAPCPICRMSLTRKVGLWLVGLRLVGLGPGDLVLAVCLLGVWLVGLKLWLSIQGRS